MEPRIRVGIDVGGDSHRVAVASPQGVLLEEFDIGHCREGFDEFFGRVDSHRQGLPVVVAMEGYGGHARPLDRLIREHGYELMSVNNFKLARFREVFPGPAKTDRLDARLILDLFHLQQTLPASKGTLARVYESPAENEQLKRLSRRRVELVEERVRATNRMGADLKSVCPELAGITGSVDNLWFLRFISSRDDLRSLARMRAQSILAIPGIGVKYAGVIRGWQARAVFSPEVSYVGHMVIADARRVLELRDQIAALESAMADVAASSEIARRLATIPGFGPVSTCELAGEIGTLERFASEASLALYLGMCPLDNQSGKYQGTRSPRHVNKLAKGAMMAAVDHHIRQVPQSRALYERKRAEGKKHNQAVRVVGRTLVRVIWSMLRDERDYEWRDI